MNVQPSAKNNVNFTSVIPLKVFVNGRLSKDCEIIKKAGHSASRILSNDARGNKKSLGIIREFIKHDKDFSYANKLISLR